MPLPMVEDEVVLKRPKKLPNIPGITPDTKKGLKWKSLKYMAAHDEDRKILGHVLKKPVRHLFRLVRSLMKKRAYRKRDGDFYFYNLSSYEEFQKLLKDHHLVLGFSYCHKPFECPSGRFNDQCIAKKDHPVCRQCFIGQAFNMAPERTTKLAIPTIHYIGEKMFEVMAQHKKVVFLITACELTLEMFGDYGNMAGAKGLGVRLDGRICNTMKAFDLSEKGIKPGLTVVLPKTKRKILELLDPTN